MLATELIAELEEAVDRHGDVVVFVGADGTKPVGEVRPYDENGDTKGPIAEFCIIADGD